MSAHGSEHFVQQYRELRSDGNSQEIALGVLRREGASFLFCMKAIHDVDGLSFGEAKRAVLQSDAWSDKREESEAFWTEIARQLEAETGETPVPNPRATP